MTRARRPQPRPGVPPGEGPRGAPAGRERWFPSPSRAAPRCASCTASGGTRRTSTSPSSAPAPATTSVGYLERGPVGAPAGGVPRRDRPGERPEGRPQRVRALPGPPPRAGAVRPPRGSPLGEARGGHAAPEGRGGGDHGRPPACPPAAPAPRPRVAPGRQAPRDPAAALAQGPRLLRPRLVPERPGLAGSEPRPPEQRPRTRRDGAAPALTEATWVEAVRARLRSVGWEALAADVGPAPRVFRGPGAA